MDNTIETHKYKPGDLVGISAECVLNCRIISCIPKVNGKGFSYVARAEEIPELLEAFFSKNKEFVLLERHIIEAKVDTSENEVLDNFNDERALHLSGKGTVY